VVLAVDAGTTGVTVLLVTDAADVLARGYAEFAQHFPRPGWVEHAPEEIWQAALTATQSALDAAPNAVVRAVGVTNQREDRGPLGPAYVGGAAACDRLAGPAYLVDL